MLPAYKRLVIDEGHHLEDAAAAHLGQQVSRRGVRRAELSDEEIDAAITNLCRCGSTPRLRAAIREASLAMPRLAPRALG